MKSPNNILRRILEDMKALRCAIDEIIACNPCGGGGSPTVGLLDVMPGTNITIDKTNPLKPIINAVWGGAVNGELIKVIENGKAGYGLRGVDTSVFGNTGTDAFNFGKSTTVSSTKGATGDRAVNFGLDNTTSGKNSLSIGNDNQNPYNDSIVVGSKFRGFSTNGYSTGSVFLADYTRNNLTVHNNIYASLIGGSDSIIGTPNATLNQSVIYQSVINGWNNNIYAGESSLAVGQALLGGAARCAIVGVANEDLTSTIATQKTEDRQAYNPRFIVGVGNWNSDSNTGTRANGFVVMSDGTASFPSLTNLMIDNSDGKSAVTKDWVIANSGGGGSTGDLQAVTDIGNETTNDIIVKQGAAKAIHNSNGLYTESGAKPYGLSLSNQGLFLGRFGNDEEDYFTRYLQDRIELREYVVGLGTTRGVLKYPYLDSESTERYLPVSVNGEVADVNGNITIPTGGGGSVQSVTGIGVDNTDPENPVINIKALQTEDTGAEVTLYQYGNFCNSQTANLNKTFTYAFTNNVNPVGEQATIYIKTEVGDTGFPTLTGGVYISGANFVEDEFYDMFIWNNGEDVLYTFTSRNNTGGGGGATSYNELTDKAIVDLPTINTPLNNALSSKVDKVAGKGLSTNDYTTAEKNKLSGIEAGAEVNVQSDWDSTSGDDFILNKPTSFPPSSHTHPISQVTGLQTALDGKMDNADIGPVRIFNQDPLTTVTATGTSWNTFLGTNKVELTAAQVAAGKSYSLRVFGKFQTTNSTSAIRKFRAAITAGGSTEYQEAVFETSVNAEAQADISGIFDFGGTTVNTLVGFYGSGMLLKADGISPIGFITSSGSPLDTTNGVTIDFQFQGAFAEDEFISRKIQVLDINNQVILTV